MESADGLCTRKHTILSTNWKGLTGTETWGTCSPSILAVCELTCAIYHEERYYQCPRPPALGRRHSLTLIRAPDHHQHNQGNRGSRAEMESSLQVPRLSQALPVSGCDAIRPGDNHISTINKTHENREHPHTGTGVRSGEMWGVWQSELYWELSWVRECWSDRPARPPVFTGMPWDLNSELWGTTVVLTVLSAHSRTLFYSPPLPPSQDGLLLKWSDQTRSIAGPNQLFGPAFLRHSVSSRAGIKYGV